MTQPYPTRRDFLKTTLAAAVVFGAGGKALARRSHGPSPRRKREIWGQVMQSGIITCPVCGDGRERVAPSEAVLSVYQCPSCLTWLSPEGEHCIFCRHGDGPCPALQPFNP
jgi:anaerobic selenocysteine-containing dehydrogenase